MARYRYIFGTLRSEQVIEEIPLFGVYMTMEMNVGGEFQGTFQLDMTGKDNATLMSACEPGRTWVAVERDDNCIWHGYIWSRTYSAQSKTLQLFAQSFERYIEKRRIMQDTVFVATEQRNIFRSLWTQLQGDTGSNINVNVPAAFSDVVLKDLNVLATDGKYYYDVMTALANANDGFDWYIGLTKVGTQYQKDLRIGYPTLGTNPFTGMIVFEYPGNITQYYFTEAMGEAGTNVFILGEGEGSTMHLGTSVATDLLDQGFARWDVDVSRKDINDQSVIDQMAIIEGANRRPPMPVIKLQVKSDREPGFGSYNLGDTCGIVIKDARFPGNGLFLRKRLLRWELTPPSSDASEEASLFFEGDPDV